MTNPNTVQSGFRGRYDDGNETTATWIADLNTGWTQLVNTTFRVRFAVEETNNANSIKSRVIHYSYDGGGYTAVGTATSEIKLVDSANVTDDGTTTQQISSGTFVAGRIDENGTVSSVTIKNNRTEYEYVLYINSANVVHAKTIALRVYEADGTALNSYTQTPTVTVRKPVALTSKNAITAAPTVSKPTIGQKHNLTSKSVVSDVPTVNKPTLEIPNDPPDTPTLLSPEDTDYVDTLTPEFTFYTDDPDLDDVEYQIQIDPSTDFDSQPPDEIDPVWAETQPDGDVNREWRGSAVSNDGSVMLAGVYKLRLYLSTDGGDHWAETQPDGDVNYWWTTCSMSADGSVMLAGTGYDGLYLSTDNGDNWNEIQPSGYGDDYWWSSAMSQDGNVMIVGAGRLYLSTDGGDNWDEVQPAGNVDWEWTTVSISANGEIILAGCGSDSGTRLYLSTDSGDNWDEVQPDGDVDHWWLSSAMSDDGSIMLAGNEENPHLSTDGGDSWSKVSASPSEYNWHLCAMSADGQIMVLGQYFYRLHLSVNGGDNWDEVRPAGNADIGWITGSMSANGAVILTGVNNGRLYLGITPGQPLINAVSSTDAGFENVDTPLDTHPFNSGDTIKYTTQVELDDTETYYWRVRAIDPDA